MLKWLTARLSEASTWRGIILLLTALGVRLSPDLTEAIITAGIALAGLVGVITADEPKTKLPPIELQGKSETRFQRYDDPDDHHSDSAVHRMRDAVSAEAPSEINMDKHETGFNS